MESLNKFFDSSSPIVLNKSTATDFTNSVYVGRPSKFGNPFPIKSDAPKDRIKSIELYKEYLFTSGLIDDIHELKGKNLVCWCAPKLCHANVLINLANKE